MIRFRPRGAAIALAASLLLLAPARPALADPSALWNIVNGECVPDQQAHNSPKPCSTVALAEGYAILKDIRGDFQYLLIPTKRVSGIDDPFILQPDAPDYFAQAWANRSWVEHSLGHDVPRGDLSLAINSKYGRTQNQLHIHIDCIRPDVAKTLAGKSADIGSSWQTITLPPRGHTYQVRRIDDATLAHTDPFLLVAAQNAKIGHDMAAETIMLAGAEFPGGKNGFYLLSDTANLAAGNPGAAEELQDHTCAIAAAP
jgi:CDP-diacylglycerol pyrophosphatase